MTSNRTNTAKKRSYLATAMAMGLAAAVASGPAKADVNDSDATWASHFDLGIDVSGVARSPAGVRDFLSDFGPETQNAIMRGCETYMLHPNTAHSVDTLPFCRVAVGVPTGGAATSSRIVNFGAATVPAPPAPSYKQPRPVYRLPYPFNDENDF